MGTIYSVDASGNITASTISVTESMGVGTVIPPAPVNGDLYYNTTNNLFQFYENGAWVGLGGIQLWQRNGNILSPATPGDILQAGNGSQTNPAYAFETSTTSGMYYDGTNGFVGINYGGLLSAAFDGNGMNMHGATIYGSISASGDLNLESTTDITKGKIVSKNDLQVNTRYFNSTVVNFTDNDTTPSVAGGNVFKFNTSGSTTVTAFDDGVAGQMITMISDGAVSTIIQNNASIKLQGAVDYNMAQYSTLQLVYDGTVWYEVSRSVN